MQTSNRRRVLAALAVMACLAGCGPPRDDPYAAISNPPLVPGRLHTVTLGTDQESIFARLSQAGYQPMTFDSNYPAAARVQASIWSVPESVVAAAREFKAPGDAPNIRVLALPLTAKGQDPAAAVNRSFFRNVLGTDVPVVPANLAAGEDVRVLVFAYVIPSVIQANRRLRESGIPVIFDPVGITSAYSGDHKTLAIRAPDGVIVQLVESSAE